MIQRWAIHPFYQFWYILQFIFQCIYFALYVFMIEWRINKQTKQTKANPQSAFLSDPKELWYSFLMSGVRMLHFSKDQLMNIYLNPPILYHGFKIVWHICKHSWSLTWNFFCRWLLTLVRRILWSFRTVNRGDFGHPKKDYSLFYILLPPTFSKNIFIWSFEAIYISTLWITIICLYNMLSYLIFMYFSEIH